MKRYKKLFKEIHGEKQIKLWIIDALQTAYKRKPSREEIEDAFESVLTDGMVDLENDEDVKDFVMRIA